MIRILVVDDDRTFASLLEGFLSRHGFEAVIKRDVKTAVSEMRKTEFQILLLDFRLPDGNGLDVLAESRKSQQSAQAIIMTSFNDVRTAVTAMRLGAFDYITKPVNPDELLMLIRAARKDKSESAAVSADAGSRRLSGNSEASSKLDEYIDLVSPTDMSVVIQGESGTGKEYAARVIHEKSKRAAKPFVAIDCGTLTGELAASELFGHKKGSFTGASEDKPGQFEFANGGTIFLDEIGNLSYEVQVKLLRALQERQIQPIGSHQLVPVDVRIITATNDDLLLNIREGGFREDLFHRLNEFKLQLPPLRDRGKDLDLFTAHFIKEANADLDRRVEGLSEEVQKVFSAYDWPGNLRELRNVIRRMVLLSKSNIAGIETLPDEMILSLKLQTYRPNDLKGQNEANEKDLIIKTLHKVKFNKSMAARILNIDRKTLYSKMEKYGID